MIADVLPRLAVALALAASPGSVAATVPAVFSLEPAPWPARQAGQQQAVERARDLFRQALAAAREERFERARALALEGLELHPNDADGLNLLGEIEEQLGNVDAAIAAYERAGRADPSWVMPFRNLGRLFLAQQQFRAAVAPLERATELVDDDPVPFAWLGTAHRQSGRASAARTAFERAWELDPASVELALEVTRSRIATGDVEGAIDAAERATELAPRNPVAWANLADLLMRSDAISDRVRAPGAYRRILEMQPDNPDLWLSLAEIYRDLGLPAEQEDAIRQAIELGAESAETLMLLGRVIHGQGLHEEATEIFSRVLELDPESGDAYYLRGQSLFNLNRLDEALSDVSRAIELRPGDPGPLLTAARLYMLKGQLDEADRYIQEAVATGVASTTADLLLGRLRLQQDRVEEAIPHLERAARAVPDMIDADYLLARALMRTGEVERAQRLMDEYRGKYREHQDRNISSLRGGQLGQGQELLTRARLHLVEDRPEEAVDQLQAALELSPDDREAWALLARAYSALGNTADASQARERAGVADATASPRTEESPPPDADTAFRRALAAARESRFDEARELVRQGLESRPDDPVGLNLLGELSEQVGDTEAAITSYRAAIQAGPDQLAPFRNLGRLYLQQEQFRAAVVPLERAVRLAPEDPTLHTWLGIAHRAAGRLDAAREAFERAWELDASSLPLALSLAGARMSTGDFEGAVAAAEAATELAPSSPTPWTVLGEILVRGESPDSLARAPAAYREAIALQPEDPGLWLGLAEIYGTLGLRAEQEEALRTAIVRGADGPETRFELAQVINRQGRYQDLVTTLTELLDAHPEHAEAHYLRAHAHYNLNQVDSALEDIRRAIELSPGNVEVLLTGARYLMVHGSREESERLIERALATGQRPAMANFLLGRLRVLEGRPEEAVPPLERAVVATPDLVDADYLLAQTLIQVGEVERGRELMAQYQEKLRAATDQQAGARRESLERQAPIYRLRGHVYLEEGRPEEALEQLQAAIDRDPEHPDAWSLLARAYEALGRDTEARDARDRARELRNPAQRP